MVWQRRTRREKEKEKQQKERKEKSLITSKIEKGKERMAKVRAGRVWVWCLGQDLVVVVVS